jgi:hypothetical protein
MQATQLKQDQLLILLITPVLALLQVVNATEN